MCQAFQTTEGLLNFHLKVGRPAIVTLAETLSKVTK